VLDFKIRKEERISVSICS